MKAVTLNTYARTVNAFLKWAHDEGQANTLVRIPRLKEEKKVIAAFTSSQVERIVALKPRSVRDRRSHVLMCLLLDTGMRIAEALSLEREHVNLDDCLIQVLGKGAKERVVPITLAMRRMLFRHMQAAPKGGNLVFFSGTGDALNERNALRDVVRIFEKAGIAGVRCSPHSCRHTFALGYIRAGGDPFRLQRLLGHEKIETTRKYCQLAVEDLQAVHEKYSAFARAAR
jgi:site-specific recombinase XerD